MWDGLGRSGAFEPRWLTAMEEKIGFLIQLRTGFELYTLTDTGIFLLRPNRIWDPQLHKKDNLSVNTFIYINKLEYC